MDVTIGIPTYFGGQMVQNCINSIFNVIAQPKIYVFKNDIGWLKACNLIMRSTTTDILLLNDDTVVLTDLVKEMSALAYSKPTIGIVGAKALSLNGETIINYGIYIATDGNTAHKHYGQPRSSVKVEIQKAVEGSCIYIKRELLDQIGYFDEQYGMGYREEIDLAFRAKEAGWNVVSCPTAEYIHMVGQTHGKVGVTNSTYDYFMSKWGDKLKLGLV